MKNSRHGVNLLSLFYGWQIMAGISSHRNQTLVELFTVNKVRNDFAKTHIEIILAWGKYR